MHRYLTILTLCLAASAPAFAADNETPITVKVGGLVFADYTDSADDVRPSSFQITRAYLNVTGTITPMLSFRLTPDFAKDNGRIKYAYGQLNLDKWTTKGSWIRAGTHQTPYLEYVESVYRYRFQGTSFTEREGFLTSSDIGVSAHYNFPGERGDVHAGIYNGEGYAKPETNDHKAFQLRASYRPTYRSLKGLRLTAFAVLDRATGDIPRDRLIATASYEHPRFSAGLDFLTARDAVDSRGWSAWTTPKLGHGFEALLRYDSMSEPTSHTRDIAGLAYWLPNAPKGTTAAVLIDRDHATGGGKGDTRYGVKVVLGF